MEELTVHLSRITSERTNRVTGGKSENKFASVLVKFYYNLNKSVRLVYPDSAFQIYRADAWITKFTAEMLRQQSDKDSRKTRLRKKFVACRNWVVSFARYCQVIIL